MPTPRVIVFNGGRNYQEGTALLVPEVLRKYIGKEKISKYHAPRFLVLIKGNCGEKELFLKAVVVGVIAVAIFAGIVAFSNTVFSGPENRDKRKQLD